MNYGDGDGKNAGPLTTLDIAGHEISHGLTERTAGLVYDGESGGLNEAMSDIFGTGVEWYASQKNQAVQFEHLERGRPAQPGAPGRESAQHPAVADRRGEAGGLRYPSDGRRAEGA
jgi:hypothetical protein